MFTPSAGRNGVSITLVTQYDIHLVHAIEEQTRELPEQLHHGPLEDDSLFLGRL